MDSVGTKKIKKGGIENENQNDEHNRKNGGCRLYLTVLANVLGASVWALFLCPFASDPHDTKFWSNEKDKSETNT